MSLLITALALVMGMAAVLFLLRAKRGSPRACMGATVCALAAVVLSVGRLLPLGNEGRDSTRQDADHYQEVLGAYVGAQVAARYGGQRALVLLPPGPQGDYAFDRGNAVLVKALGEALTSGGMELVTAKLPVDGNFEAKVQSLIQESGDPASIAMTVIPELAAAVAQFDTARLNQVIKDFGERADVIVSTVAFSHALDGKVLLRKGEGPPLVIVGSPVVEVAAGLEGSVLAGVALPRGGADAWKPGDAGPADLDSAFHKWFIWVTAENASALAGQHPSI